LAVAVADESLAAAGVGDVLAGEPAGEDVDLFHLREVDGGDVAVVGDVGPVVVEDLGRVGVELDMPRDGAADSLLDAHVESAVQ